MRSVVPKRHRNGVAGLDPAMPLFVLTPASDRLNSTDGHIVDVIHTCAGRLGFLAELGTSDFYPNGGEFQPGCGLDPFGGYTPDPSILYSLGSTSSRDASRDAIPPHIRKVFRGSLRSTASPSGQQPWRHGSPRSQREY